VKIIKKNGGPEASLHEALERVVSLRRLELMLLRLPQVESFRSAIGTRHERLALYVRWIDDDGHWGIGECSCRPDPYYSGELVAGAVLVLRDHLFPQLPRQATIAQLLKVFGRFRGWPFTLAAVEDAIWDLGRRQGRDDLWDSWPGERLEQIPVGVSLGLFDSPAAAVRRVDDALSEGYRRVKMKVAPSMDVETVVAVRRAFGDLHLGFDANGSCGEDDTLFLRSLAELEPALIEQPFAPSRLDLCQDLKEREPEIRLCLDESIVDLGSLHSAMRLTALDEVNLKPGRVGGQRAAREILGCCHDAGLPVWVGGMFESGVGRHANLRVASRIAAAEAHDLSPSTRYFQADVVRRPVTMDREGFVDLSDERPVELDEEIFERFLVERHVLEKE
jgi:O-succinylbenzoate synthase